MKKQYVRKHLGPGRDGTSYYLDEKMTILHREDGPAREYADGDKFWYIDGLLHREDGPAVETANGNKRWYFKGKLHRKDGPAVEESDGHKEWLIDGKYHREDGPAVEYADGSNEWHLNDVLLTEEQVIEKLNEKLREMHKKKGRGIRTIR